MPGERLRKSFELSSGKVALALALDVALDPSAWIVRAPFPLHRQRAQLAGERDHARSPDMVRSLW